jgi:hypothetical protein
MRKELPKLSLPPRDNWRALLLAVILRRSAVTRQETQEGRTHSGDHSSRIIQKKLFSCTNHDDGTAQPIVHAAVPSGPAPPRLASPIAITVTMPITGALITHWPKPSFDSSSPHIGRGIRRKLEKRQRMYHGRAVSVGVGVVPFVPNFERTSLTKLSNDLVFEKYRKQKMRMGAN